jgi:formate dehydrogenase iron-sulfur subunit
LILSRAIELARDNGWLGDDIQGSGFSFEIELHLGAGSYVCGEETAMLESLEGKRGIVRYKPPLPAIEGLFGQPTVVNNVVTLASVANIVNLGAEKYASFGVDRSKGTLAFQLAGNVKRGGLVEKGFGMTLREIIEDWGGGTASGRPVKAVQVGGPLGAYLSAEQLDTPLAYEAFIEIGAMLGHGGIVVFDDTVNMAQQARFAMEFCAIESCGKCTPCRIGSMRGVEVVDKIVAGENREQNFELLAELCDTMEDASLCAMGGMTPYPVRSALKHFAEDFASAGSADA